MNIVIIGGGIAGTTAAGELRLLDKKANITIIDSEEHPVYSRVLLLPYVLKDVHREKLFLKKMSWYDAQSIELMSTTSVIGIDSVNKHVATSDGRELPYDKLLITTGLDVRLLAQDKRGVCYFKTLADADNLLTLIHERIAEKNKKAVVYGGGFISMDLLSIFKKYDFETTVVLRSGGLFSKVISPGAQKLLEMHARKNGVDFLFNAPEIMLLGENELLGVRVGEREIPAGVLAVGIGLAPSLSLFADSGISVEQGVVCDEFLQTNIPGIFAAGDIAQYNDLVLQKKMRYGNWTNAIMQGRAVAPNMLGNKKPFQLVSSYSTSLFGKELVFVGDVDRAAADEVRQELLDDENSTEVFVRDGKIVGAVLIGKVKHRQEIVNVIWSKPLTSNL